MFTLLLVAFGITSLSPHVDGAWGRKVDEPGREGWYYYRAPGAARGFRFYGRVRTDGRIEQIQAPVPNYFPFA